MPCPGKQTVLGRRSPNKMLSFLWADQMEPVRWLKRAECDPCSAVVPPSLGPLCFLPAAHCWRLQVTAVLRALLSAMFWLLPVQCFASAQSLGCTAQLGWGLSCGRAQL